MHDVAHVAAKAGYRRRAYDAYLQTQVCASPEELRATLRVRAGYISRLIARYFPKDKEAVILDVGCGYGGILHQLQAEGYRRLSGFDISPQQVAAAHSLGLTQVRCADLEESLKSIRDASVDVVIVFDVLEHQTKDEALRWLDEFQRILKPRGRVIVHVPNGEGIFAGRMRYADITHEAAYTTQSLAQMAALAGFSETQFAEDVPLVHGPASLVRYLIWKTLRVPFRLLHLAETGDLGRKLILTQNLIGVLIR